MIRAMEFCMFVALCVRVWFGDGEANKGDISARHSRYLIIALCMHVCGLTTYKYISNNELYIEQLCGKHQKYRGIYKQK